MAEGRVDYGFISTWFKGFENIYASESYIDNVIILTWCFYCHYFTLSNI